MHSRFSGLLARLSPVRRARQWMLARLRLSDHLRLTQANVYIIPSRAGWALALTLCVLLVAAINYQLNLGYLLTFLLAGSAMMAMHVTHNNLRGLQLTARTPEGLLHQGQSARLGLLLQGGTRDRWGLALRPAGAPPQAPEAPSKRRRKAPRPGMEPKRKPVLTEEERRARIAAKRRREQAAAQGNAAPAQKTRRPAEETAEE